MASIPKTSLKRMSETITAGSEEDFDVVCDYCQEDGKRVVAVAFCPSCQEHLCCNCKDNHKKTRATRNHVLMDALQKSAASVGKNPGPVSVDIADPIADRCPKHPEKLIEFFCSSHQQLACYICVPLLHRTCDDNVSYIRDVSSQVRQSDELRNTLAELKNLLATLESSQTRAKQCQQQTEENYNQLVSEIILCRQRIKQHFDRLEKELLLQASRLRKEKLDSLTSQNPVCDILISEIRGISTDLDKKCNLKHNSQLFIALQAAKEKIKTWETEANTISRSSQASCFVFHQDAKLEEVTTVARLGTVSVIESCTASSNKACPSSANKACPASVNKTCPSSAKFLQDINMKLSKDKSSCDITGIAALADGRLAATDWNNQSVKLVDTAARKVTESVSLTSAPRDITVVDGDQLAVVLYDKNHIQLLNLTPKLSLSHTLPVPGCYRGITYSEGNYILTCNAPVASVHICDKSGQLLRKIETDKTGNQLFSSVYKVAVSPDQSTIYISDCEANKVVCLNHAGVVMATYSNARFRDPRGLAVVDCGCVLLCSCDDNSVLLLGGEGSRVKVLLGREDGLEYPWAVAHSHNTIYVSSTYSNTIKAFTLEQ